MARLSGLAAYRAQQRARAVGAGLVGVKLPPYPFVDLLGDSITARLFDNPAAATSYRNGGYVTHLRTLSGQAFDVQAGNNFGLSGDTTGPSAAGPGMISRLDAMAASNGSAALFLGGTNDIGQAMSVSWSTANYLTILNRLTARYDVTFVVSVLPRTSQVSTRQVEVTARNAWLRAYCAASGGKAVYIDAYSAWLDPATMDIRVGYSDDGLHPNPNGGYVLANVIWQKMQQYLSAQSRWNYAAGAADVFNGTTAPFGNKLSNANFAAASGGTKASLIAGDIPSGYSLTGGVAGNTGTVTASIVAASDGMGDWLQIEWSGRSGTNEQFGFGLSLPFSSGKYAAGEKMRAGFEVDIDFLTNSYGPWLRIQEVPGSTGAATYHDMAASSAAALYTDLVFEGAHRQSLLTLPFTAQTILGNGSPQIAMYTNINMTSSASGGASGRLRIRRPTLRRVA